MAQSGRMPSRAEIDATVVQHEVADPHGSFVLGASAGSGKTKTLVDRFVRLCLDGCPAKAILAITFTKRAAVGIKAKLARRAADYATLSEPELRQRLHDLLDRDPSPAQMARAASLYEEILEDSCGLQVGTVHHFCQVILNRFAAEAGLDPHFAILEKEDELQDEAFEMLEAAVAKDERERLAYARLDGRPSGARRRLKSILRDRVHLERQLGHIETEGATPEERRSVLLTWLRVELHARLFAGTCLADVAEPDATGLAGPLAAALDDFASEGLALLSAAETGGTTPGFVKSCEEMASRARAAAEILKSEAGGDAGRVRETAAEARGIFLTAAGKLRSLSGRKPTKTARLAAFADAARPTLEVLALMDLVDCFDANVLLLRFGLRLLDIYSSLKARDRRIDFQDLETQAWRLMRDPEHGLYVQYRLDEELRHLLVDEFQDTNYNQWEILEPFVSEFLSGDPGRSVFFVGDVKQSIYRFRGAEPRLFQTAVDRLRERPGGGVRSLPTNFRSAAGIVDAVGDLFETEPLASLLPPGQRESVRQLSWREQDRGSVHVLPAFEADEDAGLSGDEIAARAAAAIVEHMVAETGCGYGGVLMLCRSRTHIAVYEQALREAGIPYVPAGRGQLASSREVQDLLALLRWLVFPDDDLALAATLRSPLFRVAEERVQAVFGARLRAKTSLWNLLEAQRETSAIELSDEVGLLRRWLDRVGRGSCHDLLRDIYREGSLPEGFTAALGPQAGYNLLRVHDLALNSTLSGRATLRDLIDVIHRAALSAGEEEAVLPGAKGTGRVRLMTVHGAKGLQSPVVLLVDADVPSRERISTLALEPESIGGPKLYDVPSSVLRGPLDAGGEPLLEAVLAPAAEAERAAMRREEANILYVALTRAADHLFVLGGRPERKGQRLSMLDHLRSAGEGKIALDAPDWLDTEVEPGPRSEAADAVGPIEAGRQWTPPSLPGGVRVLSPSTLVEASLDTKAADVSAEDRDPEARRTALEHGIAVHRWLERAAVAGEMPDGVGDAWQEAAAVFANPEFDWIFHPSGDGADGRCEAPLIHRRPVDATAKDAREERVEGVVDRLVLRPGRVDIIDYKTNRDADPDRLGEHYRPQMEAYRDAARALWPERAVHVWLLLTRPLTDSGRGLLMEIEPMSP